jgi:hypothetical protein
LSTNTNPETCTSNCRCPLSNPSCTLAACTSNCKCQTGGCAMPKCTHNCKCQGGKCDMPSCGSNCKCQSGGCPMPKCTTACKCTGGGCSSSVEQEEFLEEIESTESESEPVGNTSGEEEFPACVTPAYNGEDQVSICRIYCNCYKECFDSNPSHANFITARLRTKCCLHGS